MNIKLFFVITSFFSVQLFAETEVQKAQGAIHFEYLRAIGGACSLPNYDSGFLKYSYDSDCIAEHKADLLKACGSDAGSHFEGLCSALQNGAEG